MYFNKKSPLAEQCITNLIFWWKFKTRWEYELLGSSGHNDIRKLSHPLFSPVCLFSCFYIWSPWTLPAPPEGQHQLAFVEFLGIYIAPFTWSYCRDSQYLLQQELIWRTDLVGTQEIQWSLANLFHLYRRVLLPLRRLQRHFFPVRFVLKCVSQWLTLAQTPTSSIYNVLQFLDA